MAMARNTKMFTLTIPIFLCRTLFHLNSSYISLLSCQKLVSTHAPLFFGKTCVPKNNVYHIGSKDDVNTPSAMHFLTAIVVYRPCLQTGYLMSQTTSNIRCLDNTGVFLNAFHGLTSLIFSTWIL